MPNKDQNCVWDLIDSIKFAMLVTHDGNADELRARPMHAHGKREEDTIYFLTDRRSSWPFAQLYPGQTGEDSGRRLAQLLRREQPKLVLRGLLSWPGLPPLAKEVPALHQLLNQQWERVPDVFVRYPLPIGREPEWWVISVLRPCDPEHECLRFGDFVKTQKFKLR